MFKGKEIVEIGRFVDDEIVSIEPAQKINNNSELVYEKGKGKIDFKMLLSVIRLFNFSNASFIISLCLNARLGTQSILNQAASLVFLFSFIIFIFILRYFFINFSKYSITNE